VFKTIQFAGIPILLGAVYGSSTYGGRSRLLPLLAIPAWFVAYMVAGIWLNRFVCPCCGKLYYWRWKLKGALERQKNWRDCHHCGLHQDALPTQA
jgi:hypothetical protein